MISPKYELNSLLDTVQLARELVVTFGSRQILLLEGPVGVGKTQFVKALVEEVLGLDTTSNVNSGLGEVCSPSFSIHNVYQANGLEVDHLDFYRVQSEDELESTGFWDLFSKKRGLIIIEWSDLIDSQMLPRNWNQTKIVFSFLGPDRRQAAVFLRS